MSLTVGQVARLTGVSVRTLHHYDEIGLLQPSMRSEAGYRLYGPADLERLQQVLFFRELSFSLDEILQILSDPELQVASALRMQRHLLVEKAARVSALIAAVDAALFRLEKGMAMETENVPAMFKDFDPSQYEQEAEERWGSSDSYRESKKRTARYTQRDWEILKAEGQDIFRRLAALLDAGTAATDPAAMQLAEAHREHISRWFYPCSKPMHRGLGELYVNDARFTANIDRTRPGLARYACAAFRANSERE
jgi:DNA-binding transcriptional MerR regulator